MEKLKSNLVKEEILRLKDDYPLSSSQMSAAEDLFYKLMNENKNVNKSIDLQLSLLDKIVHDLATNMTEKKIFLEHSDISHLSFYDTFLAEGESEKIIDKLHKKGISTDVLRGVKAGKAQELSVMTDKGRVEIYVDLNPSPEGNDDTDDTLTIKLNGKVIYDWDRYSGYDEYYSDDTEKDIPETFQNTKSGYRRVNTLISREITPQGEFTYEKATSKSGNDYIIKRDNKGRFAKQ